MARLTPEEKQIKLGILKEFYKKGRYPYQNDDFLDMDLKINSLHLDNRQLYSFEKYMLENDPESLKGETFDLLSDIVFNDLKSLVDEYSKKETQAEIEYFFSRSNGVKNFKRHFEGLMRIDSDKVIQKLSNNDIDNITEPLDIIKQLGFDLADGKSPLEHTTELKIKEIQKLDTANLDKDVLIEIFTKDVIEIDDSFDNIISAFLGKIYQVERTEINGWFIEVIKSDFDEIIEILNDPDNNSTEVIQKEIFNLINNRGLKVSNNEFVKPFIDRDEMKEQMTFNYATSGMADILYFPKNQSGKKLVANNISSWDNSEHTFSIFHHSYKAKQLNDLIGDLHEDAIVIKHIKKDEEKTSKISTLIQQDFNWSIEQIKVELSQGKSVEEIFDVENISFSAVVNTSKLTVFNQQKQFKKENGQFDLEEAQQTENINTIIFSLSLIDEETQRFNSKSKTTDEIQEYRKIIEKRFETVNFGILSKKGKYTETTNNTIKESIEEFLSFVSSNYKLFEKYNINQRKNDFVYDVKRFVHKAISFAETFYPEILVEYKHVLEEDLFDLCSKEKVSIENYYNQQNTENIEKDIDIIIDDIDDRERRRSLRKIINKCKTVEDLQKLKSLLENIDDINSMTKEDIDLLKDFSKGLGDGPGEPGGRGRQP